MLRSFLFVIVTATALPSLASAALFPQKIQSDHPLVERALAHFEQGSFEAAVTEPVLAEQIVSINRGLLECTSDIGYNYCLYGSLYDDDIELYLNGCGGLFNDAEGAWCVDFEDDVVCCGSLSDCCDAKVGAFIGVGIAVVLLVSLLSLGCCWCCKCCCCYEKLHGGPASNSTPVQASNSTPVQTTMATAIPESADAEKE